jgi:aspartate racemase
LDANSHRSGSVFKANQHLGIVKAESRAEYRRVMQDLASQGVQSIILGCTEISLLVNAQDSPVPLFDTTAIHARAAALKALQL